MKKKKQHRQQNEDHAQKSPSKPSRRKRIARSGLESNKPTEKDDEDGVKTEKHWKTEGSDEPLAAVVEHGIMDLLETWNHHPHMGANFDLPSPPDGLATVCMPLDTVVHTDTFMDAIPTRYGEYGHDDGDFELFTSSASESPLSTSESSGPGSESTSPTFTQPPSSPATAQSDINMTYLDHNNSPCNCLGIIVTMLEGLDELVPSGSMSIPIFTISHSTVDDILASLKTQISHAAKVLRCTICYSRREHISLLTRACEMLVGLAGGIVLSYQTQQHQAQSLNISLTAAVSPPPTPAASPTDFCVAAPTNVNPADISLDSSHSGANTSSSSPDSGNDMFLARYHTDPSEWEYLLPGRIGFQLNAMTGLLGSVRKCATGNISMAQMTRLHSAEAMVCGLARQLASPMGTTATVNMGDTRESRVA